METCAELLSVMESLISHHLELIDLEHEKVRFIIDQDWEQLEAVVEKSRIVLKHIEAAEKQRVEIVNTLGGSGTENPPSISELTDRIPSECKADILRVGETLRSTMFELKDLNRRCEQLIAGSLEVVDFTLSLLSGATSKGRTYSGDGEERAEGREHPSLVFDVKA
jgi:flagellar biosynthesis/type III secretory pathway chaperone